MADALQAAAALDPAGGGPATAEALRAVQGAVEQSVQHAQQLARLADGEGVPGRASGPEQKYVIFLCHLFL